MNEGQVIQDERISNFQKSLDTIDTAHKLEVGVFKTLLEKVTSVLKDTYTTKLRIDEQVKFLDAKTDQQEEILKLSEAELTKLNFLLAQYNNTISTVALDFQSQCHLTQETYGDHQGYIQKLLGINTPQD